MSKLTQPQLQVLLQLRRSKTALTRSQLQAKHTTVESLIYNGLATLENEIFFRISPEGLLAIFDHIKKEPFILPKEKTHFQEYEVFDLISFYFPDQSLYLLMTSREAYFEPITIGQDRLYNSAKVVEMLEFLRNKLCN
jgi:hypothetical protein